jgi:hypothetical protein
MTASVVTADCHEAVNEGQEKSAVAAGWLEYTHRGKVPVLRITRQV